MNPEAQFLKAFDEYADALFKHCFFRVSDREGAKDLVQETFARAWDHLRQGKEVRDYRAFLYRIADNLVVDFYRKKKAVSLEELGDKEKNTLFYDERGAREVEDDARRVLSEIQKLPEDYQKVVTMRYVDGLSPKEIAVIFGESENVISVRIHRGVEKLRALFLRKNKKMLKLEDILKNLRANISFSKNEKKEMRERLEEYAKFHPVRMEESARLLGQKSPFYDFSLLLFLRKRTMPIILILALMFGGGGVSYAAEGAVPGDALYQIKVKVNEEVRDLVALTPEAKADWESRLVERRLEEAEKLAAGDALDPAKQAVIEEKIAEHIEKVESRLAKVEEKKDIARASEISSNLETVLRAHGEVFVKIKEKQAQKLAVAAAPSETAGVAAETSVLTTQQSFTKDRLDSFTVKITEKAEKIAARNEAHLETLAFEDAPGRKVSAESQAKSAEKHLEELARVFEERKAEMTDDVRVEIEQRITEARAMFEKGNAALRGENYEEAFRLFQDARSLAQKIAVLIKSHLTSGIDVKKRSGEPKPPIKVPGPVRPGPAPSLIENPARKETAERALHKAAALFEDIQELLEKNQSIFQDDVWGRIKNEMTAAENLISEGKRALEAKEYGTAYLAAQKAINLLYEVNQVVFKYTESSNTDTTKEVLDAREVALDALEKAKQAISSSGAPDEIIRKAKALYEEAQYVFSKGEHAEKNGDLKEAVELYRKTMRIVEEVIRVLGSVNIKPYPIEPAPTPVPKPVACTKEYAPVCGSVSAGIVCIKAPCPSTVEKTYGNACEARVAGAEVLYKGECRAKVSEEDDTKDETIAKCDYAAPPQGCSYVKGAAYNATTGCGLVLQCATTEIFPVKTEAAPVTNTTETKTDEVKTEAAKTDSSQYNTY